MNTAQDRTEAAEDTEDAALLLRLIGGDPDAAEQVVALAPTSPSPGLLVAAALLGHDADTLGRAGDLARLPRERQLVALAAAHLRGDRDLFDALVRDHLADHPDHLLAAWVAGRPHHP